MNEDTLIQRARLLEAAVHNLAKELDPQLVGAVTDPYAEALRIAAERLVPSVWQWRIEPCYGGSAVFLITTYTGE